MPFNDPNLVGIVTGRIANGEGVAEAACIAMFGFLGLLAGGLKLLRGQLAIAIQIRFRETLEQLSQSLLGKLLGLSN